jgi:tRNA pseudouridine13 synthase
MADAYRKRRRESNACESTLGMGFSMFQTASASPFYMEGSLKTLFSDFVVRERTSTWQGGLPLRLMSLEPPKRPSPHPEESEDSQHSLRDKLKQILPAEDVEYLLSLTCRDEDRWVVGADLDKSGRAVVHEAVRKLFSGKYTSSTENSKVVVSRATRSAIRDDSRRSKPLHKQPFLHFTLYKENVDTSQALRHIAHHLGISTRQLQYAGTKDKRAVTLQRIAVRGVDPERLAKINLISMRNGCVKVGDMAFSPDGVTLGRLLGNTFEVVLREVSGRAPFSVTPEQLLDLRRALQKSGFVNYFGHQRFGTTRISTSDVGKALLRGDFKAAVEMIVVSKAEICPEAVRAVDAVTASPPDYTRALSEMPHFCFQERDMLHHLVRCPNDYRGALLAIPRTNAMMFFHSVQSLVWNIMATKRLEAGGTRPIAGDLVEDEKGAQVCAGSLEVPDDAQALVDPSVVETPLIRVRELTSEDIESARYSIADVLLPVPGPDPALKYPSHEFSSRDAYARELLAMGCENLTTDSDNLAKTFHFHGTYRNICVRVSDFEPEIRAVEAKMPLLQTDLERLTAQVEAPPLERPTGKALLMRFTLPPGSYATSLLREFAMCVRSDE